MTAAGTADPAAFAVGQLAQTLSAGYMAHAAIEVLLAHPAAAAVIDRMEAENRGPAVVPIATVERLDGSAIFYSLSHYLRDGAATPEFQGTYSRVWLGGALITLGDALGRQTPYYFDRAPDLEFIRHLRNGVAHGNRFHFTDDQPSRPAHFTGPDRRLLRDGVTPTPPGQRNFFEIDAALEGQPVLFDFIGPGDVCDLLTFVSWRLIRMGNGDPPSPLYPQRP